MRKITAVCLAGAASLALLPGCAMWRAKLGGILTGKPASAPLGGTVSFGTAPEIGSPDEGGEGVLGDDHSGNLTAYSESLEETPEESTPLVVTQQLSPQPAVAAQQQVAAAPSLASQSEMPSPPATAAVSTPPGSGSATVLLPSAQPSAGSAAARPNDVPVPMMASPEIAFRGVFFKTKSSDLNGDQKRTLKDAVYVLKEHPKLRIYVKGYTDSRGKARLNQRLSQERAATVAAYLISQGVPLRQLVVLGMGSTHPLAPNSTASGRAINRRVELEPVIEQPEEVQAPASPHVSAAARIPAPALAKLDH
jgi:outer membrane protein OmpA-like peptidoglycan-associated protein